MEGALASVIGGLTSGPVVAVPTSVGYGAGLDGRHRAAGDARFVRQRRHSGGNRQRVWSSVRDRQNDAVTRTAWFHCFAGTAGDMTMAALVDAGADPLVIAELVGRLDLDGYALTFEKRDDAAASPPLRRTSSWSTTTTVRRSPREHDSRARQLTAAYRSIRELIDAADLPERVRDRAQRTFGMLAEVEGAMHRSARRRRRVPRSRIGRRHRRHRRHVRRPGVARHRSHRLQFDHRRRGHGDGGARPACRTLRQRSPNCSPAATRRAVASTTARSWPRPPAWR